MEDMIAHTNERGVRYSRVGINNLLNPTDEDDVLENVDICTQAVFSASPEETLHQNDILVEESLEKVQFSTDERLKGLAVAEVIFERLGKLGEGLDRVFIEFQLFLRLERVACMRQTIIEDHFGRQ